MSKEALTHENTTKNPDIFKELSNDLISSGMLLEDAERSIDELIYLMEELAKHIRNLDTNLKEIKQGEN